MRRARPHARNLLEPCLECAPGPTLAVESDGESVRLIANLLDEMEDRRMTLQADWLVLLAEYVNDLFLLSDAGDRLVDDLQFFPPRAPRLDPAKAPTYPVSPGQRLF